MISAARSGRRDRNHRDRAEPPRQLSDRRKAVVRGPNAHPFYKWAAEARPKDVPRWNFHKYLVGRDGYLAEAFPETVEPSDTRVKTAIGRALAET
jgi:glutathione peroxidase